MANRDRAAARMQGNKAARMVFRLDAGQHFVVDLERPIVVVVEYICPGEAHGVFGFKWRRPQRLGIQANGRFKVLGDHVRIAKPDPVQRRVRFHFDDAPIQLDRAADVARRDHETGVLGPEIEQVGPQLDSRNSSKYSLVFAQSFNLAAVFCARFVNKDLFAHDVSAIRLRRPGPRSIGSPGQASLGSVRRPESAPGRPEQLACRRQSWERSRQPGASRPGSE